MRGQGWRGGLALWGPLLASLPLLLLGGCGSQEKPSVGSPYAADIAAAKAKASTDFEKAVFADGKITRAEYEEASQRYLECLRQHFHDVDRKIVGVQTDADGTHSYSVKGPTGIVAQYDTFDAQCRPGTIELIEPLYVAMLQNPTKANGDQQMVACLKRHGAVPPAYTVDNWKADGGAIDGVSGKPVGDPAKKTGLDVNSQVVQDCMASPER
jgi:hypothetical protein